MFLFIFGMLIKIDICDYTNNIFFENSSSALVLTEPSKKGNVGTCNAGNFILVLFNVNI